MVFVAYWLWFSLLEWVCLGGDGLTPDLLVLSLCFRCGLFGYRLEVTLGFLVGLVGCSWCFTFEMLCGVRLFCFVLSVWHVQLW